MPQPQTAEMKAAEKEAFDFMTAPPEVETPPATLPPPDAKQKPPPAPAAPPAPRATPPPPSDRKPTAPPVPPVAPVAPEPFGDDLALGDLTPAGDGTPATPPAKPTTPPAANQGDLTDEEAHALAMKDDAVTVDMAKISTSSKQSIQNLLKQREALRRENAAKIKVEADLRGQLEQRVEPAAVEALRQENAKLSARLGFYEVEATPAYQQQVVGPRNETIDAVLLLADGYGLERAKVEAALMKEPKTRNQALQAISPEFVNLALPHLAVLDRLLVKDRALRQNHPEVIKQARQQHQQASIQAQKKNGEILQTLAKSAVTFAKQSKVPFFTEIEGNEEHNKIAARLPQLVEQLIVERDPEKIAKFAALGLTVEHYHGLLRASRLKQAELEKELGRLKGSKSGARGMDRAGEPPAGNQPPPEGTSPLDAYFAERGM